MLVTSVETELVRGVVHRPEAESGKGLLLAHGAGSNCQSPILIAVANAFCRAGWVVLRLDLPFRRERPKGPPFPATAAKDRTGIREASLLLRDLVAGPIWIGGHSYGGRQATMLAAEDPAVADGLLLLSYPLHPPAKSDRMRTEHWPQLKNPCLFIHGDKDRFGSVEEMNDAVALLAAPACLVIIAGAGHELNRGRFDIEENVLKPLHDFEPWLNDQRPQASIRDKHPQAR